MPDDVDALHHRFDLIAKVGEEAQGIGRIVRDARNQSRDQNLARHHASVQFIHSAPPIACRLTRAIWTTSIPHSTLLERHARRSRSQFGAGAGPRSTAASNLSNCLGFSSLSVCTGQARGHYIGDAGNFLQAMSCHVEITHHPLGFADRSDRRAGLFGLAAIPRRAIIRRRLTCPEARACPCRRPRADRRGRKGRFSGLSDRPRHRAGLQHRRGPHPRRRPDRQDRLQGRPVRQGRATCWSRSIRGRSRPRSIRPRPRRPRTRPTSPTPISTCSAIPSSANSRPGSRPIRSAPPSRN